MSGTAALAAARRRRAGGANTSPQPMSKPTSPQQKVSLNPVQILQQHDKQIFVLTNEFNEIKKKNVPVTSEDIEFYKDKYNTLLSEMTEMKTNFVKMQTFCMETNMKVEAMNKRLESNLEEND
tara:strand:+ start:6636 stop:7004 length:369 start_codon:yes stop_codon:yes gene_type:complete